MGRVSNCAASSRPTRRSRRIRRAESFASNFLRNAVHLAHVSVPGRSRDCPWSRQTSNRRSQCWTRLDARSIAVPTIALIHRISTGNIPQSGSGKPEWSQYDIGLNGRCGSIVASGWWELGRCRMNATRTALGAGHFSRTVSRARRKRPAARHAAGRHLSLFRHSAALSTPELNRSMRVFALRGGTLADAEAIG
jgi:hypothetical protein